MTDTEIKDFLEKNPLPIRNQSFISGRHRVAAMIGRIIKKKIYSFLYISNLKKRRYDRSYFNITDKKIIFIKAKNFKKIQKNKNLIIDVSLSKNNEINRLARKLNKKKYLFFIKFKSR